MRTIVGVTFGVLVAASAARAQEPAELRPFAFLVGQWDSSGSGAPGSGTGTATFSRSLQDRVILRTSFADYPAIGDQPASRHDDLMIIHADSGVVHADYFDSEGHVIHYRAQSPAPDRAVFLSEPAAGEPTYRLTYQLTPAGVLNGEFEVAEPGTTVFTTYLAWHSSKAGG